MPSPFAAAGAAVDPSKSAPIHTGRFFTGLWTQRSPLRDAATPYLYEKFYSASRYDSLIGGMNTEITARLTLARRAGSSVYNSAALPQLNRLYEFRTQVNSKEIIHVMADTTANVSDVTASNGAASVSVLRVKLAGAAKTYFQSVGNQLVFCDGVSANKWTLSTTAWTAKTVLAGGTFIVDGANNIQLATVPNTTKVTATSYNKYVNNGVNQLQIVVQLATPMPQGPGNNVVINGITASSLLNGSVYAAQPLAPNSISGNTQSTAAPGFQYSTVNTLVFNLGQSSDTTEFVAAPANGTVALANNVSPQTSATTGATMPTWNENAGGTTTDGGLLWVCKGSAVQALGSPAPTSAPTVTQTALPVLYGPWPVSQFLLPSGFIYDAATNSAQLLVKVGITASSAPTFSATTGIETIDGATDTGAVWLSYGSCVWGGAQTFTQGRVVYPTGTGNLFQAIQGGVSGTYPSGSAATGGQPTWINSYGAITSDGTVLWKCLGGAVNRQQVGNGTLVNNGQSILDTNQNIQSLQNPGLTGTTPPVWATLLGATTNDTGNVLIWTNQGPYGQQGTAPQLYVFAGRNSITTTTTTASPQSIYVTRQIGTGILVQGMGLADPQIDFIRIYRTVQGGSTFLYIADVPNPGANGVWSYVDNTNDAQANPLIQAAISDANDPPPSNMTALTYYLGRLWSFQGSTLRYTGTADASQSSKVDAWPPLNFFTFESTGVRLWPTNIGLVCFTQSDVYIIQGQGTSDSPFYATLFQEGVGLLNYDSFAVNGSTAYLMTTAFRCVSFDPGAGETEVGFPIGDIFESAYTMAGTRMEYHEGSSADTALYVCDGTVGWYRLSTINAPESGSVWSPQAQFTSGVSAIGSIEIAPGVKRLLYALVGGGPIYMRDQSKNTDNGRTFPATAIVGSIVLAEPGELAGLHFLTLDTVATGTRTTVGLLIGEIAGTFTTYQPTKQDPPRLPPSTTVWGYRYYIAQNGKAAWCRHLQVQFSWPAEDAANELLAYTTYGFLKKDSPEN